MPEWWPLKFFIFSNWPGVTRDTFPRLHFPLRSCCREHRLTSLWGSPPLVWSRRRSIPSSCPSRRCLRPTARGRAGRRRRGGGSGSWPFPGSMVGKGGEMGIWQIIITIFTYLQSKCFYLCSFSMPALLCNHKPKWTDWIGRLMKGTELCDGEATLGGSLPPLNGPTQVPLTFLPAAAPVFVDLLQLDGLPLSALSLPMSFIRGREKGRNSFTLNSSCTHFIQSQAVKVAPESELSWSTSQAAAAATAAVCNSEQKDEWKREKR